MRPIRRLSSAFAALSLVMGGVVATAAPAHAAWNTPAQVRSIGGTGRASLFPWGMAYNPVSGRYVVTDYFNYQVRQYGADWSAMGILPQPTGASGDPESVLASVAVDPTNGDVYVAKPKPDTLAHYDRAGNRLPDVVVEPGSGTRTYTAWLSIDAAGFIYVLDSHLWNTDADPSRLIKLASGGGSQVASWDLRFPGQLATQAYGLDVAADGRIYIADSINRRIQVLGSDGTYLRSIGTAGRADAVGGLSGDLRNLLVDDAHQRIYVADALQNQIEVFGFDGRPLFHFGGEGSAPGQLLAPRQMTFGPDGRLWVTEYGNYRIQAFDPATGRSLGIRPRPLPQRPAGQLGQPRDVAVDPATGNVWVADTWNQRFQKFSADGRLLGSWGGRGNAPPYGVKYPRGIGFDPVNRRVWVANNAAGTIYVYDDKANFLFQIGSEDARNNSQPGRFEKPFGIAFGSGYAYVTDVGATYEGNAVQVKILDARTGTEVGTIPRNAKSVSVDEATGEVYIADSAGNQQKIYVYPPTGGEPLRSFGAAGVGDGLFTGLWGVTVANGVVYATDEAQSRVQAFTTAGAFLGKWGGFGTKPYQFRGPSGISHDRSGRVYVADASNDRIVVFDPAAGKPAFEFSRPTITLTSPANGSAVRAPVTIRGTAADNAAIATVEVSVRDNATGRWWDPATATWIAAQTWGFAPWRGAATGAAWSWTFPGPEHGRSYHAEARVRDIHNTLSATTATTDFTVAPAG
jgi:DNA-binding beta-propeller fold protein YncE